MWSLYLAFFTQHGFFKVHPVCGVYSYFISFYCSTVFYNMNIQHLIIYLLTDRHWVVSIFWLLLLTNAAMNICVQVVVRMYVFIFSWVYTPRSRFAEPWCNSMFNLLRNCQTAFQSSCNILHSHQQCTGFSFSTFPPTLIIIFLVIAIQMGVTSEKVPK